MFNVLLFLLYFKSASMQFSFEKLNKFFLENIICLKKIGNIIIYKEHIVYIYIYIYVYQPVFKPSSFVHKAEKTSGKIRSFGRFARLTTA